MTKHLKRHKAPKQWPIPRKGTTFVVAPSSGELPLLIVLRDMLKIAQTRKEVKRAVHAKQILINGVEASDDKIGVNLMDVVTIVPAKKNYKIVLSLQGKFDVKEVASTEAGKKVSKIIGKTILKGKKMQLNLIDGRNVLSDIKCNVNDSVIVNAIKKKIEKCLPLNEKAKVLIFAGKHAGKEGVITKVEKEDRKIKAKVGDAELEVLIKQIMIIE